MWMKLINNPILFQGRNKRKAYFEGWYFKQVSEDLKTTISIIPGISLDENDPHCFIQLISTKMSDAFKDTSLQTEYFRFPLDAFSYKEDPFYFQIADNYFSETGISIFLESEHLKLKGQIYFGAFRGIDTNWIHPNIMGFFAYIPKMECYHGIVSMTHSLKGSLDLNEEKVSFENGKGYIEKDWGRSFPNTYLWIQSNHFGESDAALMCSVANIPFMGTAFRGFICNLYLSGKEYRFASYNKSKLKVHEFSPTRTRLTLSRKDLIIKIDASMENGALLQAPHLGVMSHRIKEGLFGEVSVTLQNSSGNILFCSVGHQCGIELMPKDVMINLNQT